MIVDFSVLLKLTVNVDIGRSLPPPKKFAADLELFAIRCIKEWNDEFGKDFENEFNFVFKYLNKYKKVSMPTTPSLLGNFEKNKRKMCEYYRLISNRWPYDPWPRRDFWRTGNSDGGVSTRRNWKKSSLKWTVVYFYIVIRGSIGDGNRESVISSPVNLLNYRG